MRCPQPMIGSLPSAPFLPERAVRVGVRIRAASLQPLAAACRSAGTARMVAACTPAAPDHPCGLLYGEEAMARSTAAEAVDGSSGRAGAVRPRLGDLVPELAPDP